MKFQKERIQNFQHYLLEEEKSPATIEKYIRDVTAFYEWNAGSDVTKQTVLTYKAHLMEQYAPASVNSILSSLNSFFEVNEWHGLKVKMLKNFLKKN